MCIMCSAGSQKNVFSTDIIEERIFGFGWKIRQEVHVYGFISYMRNINEGLYRKNIFGSFSNVKVLASDDRRQRGSNNFIRSERPVCVGYTRCLG